jgi:hypothetical protein
VGRQVGVRHARRGPARPRAVGVWHSRLPRLP